MINNGNALRIQCKCENLNWNYNNNNKKTPIIKAVSGKMWTCGNTCNSSREWQRQSWRLWHAMLHGKVARAGCHGCSWDCDCKLLLLNLSSLQWAITARLVDTPSSSKGGSIGHQNKCAKNIAPHAGFHFSSAQQRLTPAPTGCSCTILQTHLPHATNSFSTSSSSGAGGCNWIELCARGAMADAQLPLMPKTSSLPICEFVT